MTPIAPDADRNNQRTIELFYDGSEQAHVAWHTVREGLTEVKRRIMLIRDGQETPEIDKILEELRSWGAEVREVVPNIRQAFHSVKFFLHDTPRVREALQQIDWYSMDVQAKAASDLLKMMPKSKFAFHALIRQPNGDLEWRPMENREIVAKPPEYPNGRTA